MKKLVVVFLIIALFGCNKTVDRPEVEASIPVLRITTTNKTPVTSKTTYQDASLVIEGDLPYTGDGEIRGRGNTTWTFPKKPFKIKFSDNTSLLNGLPAKEWVLLANYLDPSLMHNAVAMKIGKLLSIPFTNTIKPVDLWLNNEYLGSYTLTEQVEAKENRVEVGEDGVLLSLDTIIDSDDAFFASSTYKLPVIIKYPKENNDPRFRIIENEFNELEKRIAATDFPNNNYLDFFDADAMANYLIVYTLTCNEEINHPKSTYIHKKPGGKFTMGPIWDFDWAFSYEQNRVHYVNPQRPLFWQGNSKGTTFFERIANDPKIKALVKTKWLNFRENDFAELIAFVDRYANQIETSRAADFKKWQRGESDFNIEKADLRNWLELRARYMDELVSTY
ncbi:MAG: CotH kinase family protein [Spirosomaceae bacterium]|nr:CotH kinase family protein [Spirosomataceae bacterium]